MTKLWILLRNAVDLYNNKIHNKIWQVEFELKFLVQCSRPIHIMFAAADAKPRRSSGRSWLPRRLLRLLWRYTSHIWEEKKRAIIRVVVLFSLLSPPNCPVIIIIIIIIGFHSNASACVFFYGTHATQAIAFEWKSGLRRYCFHCVGLFAGVTRSSASVCLSVCLRFTDSD